eukprot:935882-Prorocentrum_minimum.AAC.1
MRGRPTRAAHESPAGWGSRVIAQGVRGGRPTRAAHESSTDWESWVSAHGVNERPANTRGARESGGLGIV